ncbi:MAG: hypothetical protein AAGI66_06995 [Cyanobacteria bacterium P01_H01_bin.74]
MQLRPGMSSSLMGRQQFSGFGWGNAQGPHSKTEGNRPRTGSEGSDGVPVLPSTPNDELSPHTKSALAAGGEAAAIYLNLRRKNNNGDPKI